MECCETAILANVAQEVYTIERHAELATQAARRLESEGFKNVRLLHGDGTLGCASLERPTSKRNWQRRGLSGRSASSIDRTQSWQATTFTLNSHGNSMNYLGRSQPRDPSGHAGRRKASGTGPSLRNPIDCK
jgi:hypothetical protein